MEFRLINTFCNVLTIVIFISVYASDSLHFETSLANMKHNYDKFMQHITQGGIYEAMVKQY